MNSAVRLSIFSAMLLAAAAFSPAGQVMEEGPLSVSPVLRPITVSRLNRALANAQDVPAQLLAKSTVTPIDPSGRTPAEDYAKYYFTGSVVKQVQAIRAELGDRGLAGDDMVPYEVQERVERLLRIESCKILRISTYWGHRRMLDYHRGMIVALLARAPVSERTWAAPRLNALDEKAMRIRANLEAEVTSCATANPWLIPNGLRGRDLWAELQQFRGELATRIDEVDEVAGHQRSSQPRTIPCQVLPVEPSGPTLRIRKTPDLNAYYPQEAIDESVTGTVRVRFGYDASGCVVEASVYRSSGSDLLDQAAIALAFDTVIVPELKDGVPATGFAVIPLHFNIPAESESSAEPAAPASRPK